MNTTHGTCPISTPWGRADHIEKIADGIWSVSTPGHGGIYLSPSRRAAAPAYLIAETNYSGGGWFEEDCDWALACAAFPVEFGPRSCYYALRTFGGNYLRERWAQYLASPLAVLLREQAAQYTPEEIAA